MSCLVGCRRWKLKKRARRSPEAVVAREKSQTEYENLGSRAAATVDAQFFPGMVDEPAGGAPRLRAGQSMTGIPTPNVAQLDLGGGKRGLVESTLPLAVETSPGHRAPIDLSLETVGGGFRPARSPVALNIPKRLEDSVQMVDSGVSLTPVGERGTVVGGSEGAIDGATVLYANTQTDADTVVKPTSVGFEEDTLLRSARSPQQLSYRVGLPKAGALMRYLAAGSRFARRGSR